MQYYIVYVKFDENGHEYAYLSDDELTAAGDQVIVPVGLEKEEKAVRVTRTEYVTETTSPYPVKWMKKVIRKLPGRPGDPLVSPDVPESVSAIIEGAFRKKISEWTDPESGDCTAPPEDYDTYRDMVLEGVDKGWPEALEAMAYASYGGNNVFPEDFKKSEECLLKLIDICEDPAPAYYNTLGYLYYYGRANGGIPQYEKAFQYFSVGAIHGIFESTYKLADMLIAGKGVPKNTAAAVRLIKSIYSENREHLEYERFECKFADVALRLGGIYERGDSVQKDPETAYSLYLQAQFAIRERMKAADYYGDRKVASNIDEAIARCKKELPADFFKSTVYAEAPYMVGALLKDSEGLDMAVMEKEGATYLMAKRADANEDGIVRKYLFTVPELDVCQLSDMVIIRIEGPEEVINYAKTESVYINHMAWSEPDQSWLFMYQDYPMIEVKCKGFSIEL